MRFSESESGETNPPTQQLTLETWRREVENQAQVDHHTASSQGQAGQEEPPPAPPPGLPHPSVPGGTSAGADRRQEGGPACAGKTTRTQAQHPGFRQDAD